METAATPTPVAVAYEPVASQVVGDAQDTPVSWAVFAPLGLGIGWRPQLLPFQASAKGKLAVNDVDLL